MSRNIGSLLDLLNADVRIDDDAVITDAVVDSVVVTDTTADEGNAA